MSRKLDAHVEPTAEAMAARFVDAWHRAERGEAVDERHLSFESWEGLSRVLTTKRLELLRHLRRHPATSVARSLEPWGATTSGCTRTWRLWPRSGLLTRVEAGLRTGYDEIRATITV